MVVVLILVRLKCRLRLVLAVVDVLVRLNRPLSMSRPFAVLVLIKVRVNTLFICARNLTCRRVPRVRLFLKNRLLNMGAVILAVMRVNWWRV